MTILGICLACARPAIAAPEAAVVASNSFGFDLYARATVANQNLIISPAGAAIALAMTVAGARGETQRQMGRVLHLDIGRLAEEHASFSRLLASLNGRDGKDGLVLRVSDRLWGQLGHPFVPQFLAMLRDRYGAPLGEVDFKGAPDAARASINKWVADTTHDRIRDIIGHRDLDARTRLVVVNAVYVKGRWQHPFAKANTHNSAFLTSKGGVTARMMSQRGDFAYAKVDSAKIIELPYRGGLSMIVVLPNAVDGLGALENQVKGSYDGWLAALATTKVELQLPTWKVRSTTTLNEILKEMGMQSAFTDADFSGISQGEGIRLDRVIQEAFVETSETGTEAAAATAGTMRFSAMLPPERFNADHPFLYFIRDPATGVILFMGRVVDPR